jgi:CubicO group peptidase (beta-lactamase class C family)
MVEAFRPVTMKNLLVLLLFAAGAHAEDRRIAEVERGLLPPVVVDGGPVWAIEERMRFYGVPGLSVAVVEGGRVAWAKGYGLADIRAGHPVTPRTMFLAGSVSKPVAAMAAVDLVERGVLPFDAGVNSLLKSWRLPENELTAKTPVTLRQLFSHSAGTTVHGFPGYPRKFPRPAIRQILDGERPANTAAVRVDLTPGTQYRYSGGGTTIAQQALADVTGLDFATLMRRRVLAPLGMTGSTYEQPLPSALHARAATGYRTPDRPVPGGWHVYPEAAAAGLWTTPSDLSRVIVEMHDALAGRPSRVLTIDGARLMLTPRFPAGGTRRHIGVGFFLEDRGGARYFTHGGSDDGFEALLLATADGAKGAVLMANTNGAMALMSEIVRAIAREYEWPDYLNVAPPVQQPSGDLLARAPGRYRVDADRVIVIHRAGQTLETPTVLGTVPLAYLTDGTLARHDRDERYRLTDSGLELIAGGKTTVAAKTAEPLTARELLDDGRVDEALAALRAAPDAMTIKRLGFDALRAKRIGDAVRLFELNVELHPTSADAWDSLAEGLLQTGRFERAAEAARKAQALLDSDPVLDERARGFFRTHIAIRLHEIEDRGR